ncbi:MAG TPA: hypothetical protein VLB27_04735, partial [candidate division Zixibacteria bacterium]|nr:hypothetical protein [candidate division Zixibacteria bacterium]
IPVGISDPEDNLVVQSVTVWPSGTYDPFTGLVCLTPQNTGMITLIVAATDECGLTGADTTWINVELTDGPVIECPSIPINAFVCGADTVCQSVAITPPDAQVSVSYGWFANGQLCFVADTAGVYQIELIATAACGADTCVITFNVAQGQKPEFSCPPDTQLLLCEPGAICIPVGALPQGAEVTVSPSGTYNAGLVCFQADTAGRYDITVIALTTCGGDTCSFSVDVNFNTPPEITPVGIQGPDTDTLISVCDPGHQEVCLEFTLTDVDSNIVQITVPPFATYDWVDSTVTICFTPDTSGSYDLWLQAADECDTATFDTVFVIIDADSTPSIICLDTVATEFCEPGSVCYPINFAPSSATLSSP